MRREKQEIIKSISEKIYRLIEEVKRENIEDEAAEFKEAFTFLWSFIEDSIKEGKSNIDYFKENNLFMNVSESKGFVRALLQIKEVMQNYSGELSSFITSLDSGLKISYKGTDND